MSLFAELKRRNVLRVAIAYLAAAWMLIQVADIVFPRLGLELSIRARKIDRGGDHKAPKGSPFQELVLLHAQIKERLAVLVKQCCDDKQQQDGQIGDDCCDLHAGKLAQRLERATEVRIQSQLA
jgi:hypothetical protein